MSMRLHAGLVLVCLLLCRHGGRAHAWRDGTHPKLRTGTKMINDLDASSIKVNLSSPLFLVSDDFLSLTLDAGGLSKSWDISLTSPLLATLAKGLAPAMLRLGGTEQDFVLFSNSTITKSPVKSVSESSLDSGRRSTSLSSVGNVTVSLTLWDSVNVFAEKAGWDLIFGLNMLLRRPWPNGTWDSSNAELLMNYTQKKGYTVNWELGNEPDHFGLVAPNIPLSAAQGTADFLALRSLVAALGLKGTVIAGPDVASINSDYMTKFVQSLKQGVINATTWHHYYESGATAVVQDFFQVSLLDTFIDEANKARSIVAQYQPGSALWLGETSSCYGGGARGLTDTYVAGFMWLDKLGIAALTNHTKVFRQSFASLSYSLVDKTLYPLPDYWLSLLHKRLVGAKVLNVSGSLAKGRYLRAYAHCARPPYSSGSVVLILLNVHISHTNATLDDSKLATSTRDVYWLTPFQNNLTSQQVTLNGKLLTLMSNTSLPELKPDSQPASDSLSIPSLSFGFYVFKDAKAAACM